jgi:hypothetical protein
MENVDIYNSLISTDILPIIVSYEQMPTENDYMAGYIFRYFIRKRNDSNGIITEVSKQTYDNFLNNASYVTLRMRWKISGGNKFEVEQLNQRSINYAQETMSNIDTYVKNLTKFYRG